MVKKLPEGVYRLTLFAYCGMSIPLAWIPTGPDPANKSACNRAGIP